MSEAEHERLSALLQAAAIDTEAAELHGELCGRLCGRAAGAEEDWLAAAIEQQPAGEALQAAEVALRELAGRTAAALEAADMSLALLLPDDAEPLEARAQALAAWCRGFLHGLGLAAAPGERLDRGDVGEIMRDFAELTKAAFTVEETAEEAESAYAELVEFVRVGAQLVHEELRTPAAPADVRGAGPH